MRVPEPVAAVRRAVREAVALPGRAGGALVVACSGGADSLALAAATRHVATAAGVAVHGVVVDHGVQAGSGEVAARAADTLETLGLDPVTVVPVTVDGAGGPEAAARRARYAALDAARPPGAPVLLGHTLDDQAETVLLGLGRGSGARSLAGMAVWDDPWLRPLLGLRRATTRAACVAQRLEPWDDPHNADPRFVRVRVRDEALPLLEEILAGGVAPALARTAAQLAEDDAALAGLAERARADATGPDGTVDVAALAACPAAVRRRALRGWLVGAGAVELTDAHLRAVDALVGRWRGQGAPPLPGGLEVIRRHGRLLVRPTGGPGPSP